MDLPRKSPIVFTFYSPIVFTFYSPIVFTFYSPIMLPFYRQHSVGFVQFEQCKESTFLETEISECGHVHRKEVTLVDFSSHFSCIFSVYLDFTKDICVPSQDISNDSRKVKKFV